MDPRMQLGETINVALESLRANKLRSFLTMLGIVIGVGAVIAMVALGRGAQQSVKERIASLGTTLLTVLPNQARGQGGVASGSDRAPLTMSDARAIVGATANYLEVRKFSIAAGRMFTEPENAARRTVAVVGSQVVTDLGIASPEALVGAPLRINGVQFEVVGVLASKGQGGGFSNPDDQILVPIETARYRLFGSDRLRSVNVLAPTEDDIPVTMAEVQRILRREHRLRPGQEDDFQIRNQADFLTTLGETTQVFTYLLAGIAAVSLLVGGIGIMNIMLVSVTERTREIGIRKALGATQKTILLQFLIEALVLCLLGGIFGIAFGAGAAIVARSAFHWNTSVGASSILLAFLFSAAVGILFGVWPARRAASLDAIESLRYE